MNTRRDFLKWGGALAASSAFSLSAQAESKIAHSKRGTAPLKITKIEPFVVYSTPPDGPLADTIDMIPVGETTGRSGIGDRLNHSFPVRNPGYSFDMLVRITTDQGIIGWGEAHAPAAPAVHVQIIEDLFAPILLGQDARDILPLWEKLYSSQRMRGYSSGFYTASIAAIDIALWDILGKFVEVPVYQLLGGKFRDSIPTYHGASSPEGTAAAMKKGFTTFKMGMNKSSTRGIEYVRQISEIIGSEGQLMIDSLGAFKLHEAIQVGRKLDELGNIGWFEDALLPEDTDSYPILTEALDTAICVGETYSNRFQFRDLFKNRGADVVNPDVGRAGGITECKRIADLAHIHGVLWTPHVSSGFPPYVAASLHLAVATPNAVIIEAGNIHDATDVRGSRGNILLKEPIQFEPGHAFVPEGHGLGIEFDDKKLAKVIVS
jgi:L-alanine-DL-glutamate epimerase-like enolase superfamily enzyme